MMSSLSGHQYLVGSTSVENGPERLITLSSLKMAHRPCSTYVWAPKNLKFKIAGLAYCIKNSNLCVRNFLKYIKFEREIFCWAHSCTGHGSRA